LEETSVNVYCVLIISSIVIFVDCILFVMVTVGMEKDTHVGLAMPPPPLLTRREVQPHAQPLKNRMQRNRVGQMVEGDVKGGGATSKGPSSAGWVGVVTS